MAWAYACLSVMSDVFKMMWPSKPCWATRTQAFLLGVLDTLDQRSVLGTVLVADGLGGLVESHLVRGHKLHAQAFELGLGFAGVVVPQFALLEIFENNPKIKAKMMTSLAEFYNANNQRLFRSYRESFGFFSLRQMFE